jgi:hypothetical protein
MRIIEAPAEYEGGDVSLFLAGGITGCPDWQQEVIRLLADTDLTLLNPRRRAFPVEADAATAQIIWEFRHLRKASAILFWFPREALCPIALYELGAWSMTDKPLFLGAHPDYERRHDLMIQTSLARPDVAVGDSLDALARAVRAWRRAPAPEQQAV